MFTINTSLTDLKVKERNIYKMLYSMNSPQVATPELGVEEARCYILFFSEGQNLSAYIGLYLPGTDRKIFYAYTSNPFPFEAVPEVEVEATGFAEDMGFLLDEISVSGMSLDDRNRWIEEQYIFGYKKPELENAAVEVKEEEKVEPVAATQEEAPAAPPKTEPQATPAPAEPAAAPPAPAAAPMPASIPSSAPETPAVPVLNVPPPQPQQQGQPVMPQYPPQPLQQPQQQGQPVMPQYPPQPLQQPQQYPLQQGQPYGQPQQYPPQHDQQYGQPQQPYGQPPQAYQQYPPQAAQQGQPVPSPYLPPQPAQQAPVPPAAPPQRKTAPATPLKAPAVKKKDQKPAAPLPRLEEREEEVPVETEMAPAPRRPSSLFEEALREGVVKPPRPKAAKAVRSATGVVARDKEALARLLASF
ncbi:MAG: hypothetical protein HGB21_06315 [Nitrospirae bacterium]|nr:hypothetical protein [Nitrospirota bacterium]